MENYLLLHKNILVSAFKLENNEVIEWNVPKSKKAISHMPLPLKIVTNYGLVDKELENSYLITTEDYNQYLKNWLNDRAIPANRDNLKTYIKDKNTLKFMIENHALSLTDCYWIKEVHEKIKWEDIKLFDSNKIDRLNIISKSHSLGEQYSGINSTLGGQLEKYWYYSYYNNQNHLMLAKRESNINSIIIVREIIASKIYKRQGYKNYCNYKYIINKNNETVGCKCRAFTSESLELITAYDLLAEHNELHYANTYERLINCACNYGGNRIQIKYQLDLQTLVDYVISNRDRHLGNIGFLRNPDTLQIVTIAPIFDSGSSVELENKKPYGIIGTTINGAYKLEDEVLNTVTNFNILDISELLSIKELDEELSKYNNGNRYSTFLDMYRLRINYLATLQN